MTGVFARGGLLAAALALLAAPLAAQTRTISGKVLEEGSRAPIAAAQLQVTGTALGALSRDDGSFTLVNVPAREVILMVRRLGYPMTASPSASRRAASRSCSRRTCLISIKSW